MKSEAPRFAARPTAATVLRIVGAASLLFAAASCRDGDPPAKDDGHAHESAPAPTNRIDIPASVRTNLGMTFAKVVRRPVSRTLRVPGRFELLPTARQEHAATLSGRVEILVAQYEKVEAGTVLFRVDAPGWRDLQEKIAAADAEIAQTQARIDSMGPLRAAHSRHESSIAEKVKLWEARLRQLDVLHEAGGGSAAAHTEARATLNETQAELADIIEKDVELQAEERTLASVLEAAQGRRELHFAAAASVTGVSADELRIVFTTERLSLPIWRSIDRIEVRARISGVVESLGVTNGGFAGETVSVVTIVDPSKLRFRARALQSDLGRIRDGLAARIVLPGTPRADEGAEIVADVRLGFSADPDDRTIDVLAAPRAAPLWARAGVAAQLEITLDGSGDALAVPASCVLRDGARPILFRRDPGNADVAVRMDADTGATDGRWIAVESGLKEGDEVVQDGAYQLLLATAGNAQKGGHFHADGTFHDGKD